MVPSVKIHQLALPRILLAQGADYKFQVNDYRATRISEVFSDFISLQHLIASAPIEPSPSETCYPKGWLVLRQSLLDGRHVLECAADTTVPSEQNKEDLKRVELRRYVRSSGANGHILTSHEGSCSMLTRDAILP